MQVPLANGQLRGIWVVSGEQVADISGIAAVLVWVGAGMGVRAGGQVAGVAGVWVLGGF